MTTLYKDMALKAIWLWTNSQQYAVHRIGPLFANVGNILDIRFQVEATNHKTFPIGVGRFVSIAETVNPFDVSGPRLIPACVRNVTPEMHHDVIVGSDIVELEEDIINGYIVLVMYGMASNKASTISFEQGYGFLTVEVR